MLKRAILICEMWINKLPTYLPVSFILTPQERGDETHGSDFVKTHSLKGGG